MLVFDQLFDQLSGQLVVIQLLSNKLLALSQSNRPWINRLTSVARLVNGSWLFAYVNCLAYWLLKTASDPRQNLSINRLRTYIRSSTRITRDHLATTRSSTLGKLLGLLGNLRSTLPRATIVDWSWCWRLKSYVGCIQATFFLHRYNSSSGGFVKRKLQLLLHQHRNRKGVDLQVVS